MSLKDANLSISPMKILKNVPPKPEVEIQDVDAFLDVQKTDAQVRAYARNLQIQGKIPKYALNSMTDNIARKALLLKYKGIYIKPELSVPEETKRIIDKYFPND